MEASVSGSALCTEAIVGKPASINAWLLGAKTVRFPSADKTCATFVDPWLARKTAATRYVRFSFA